MAYFNYYDFIQKIKTLTRENIRLYPDQWFNNEISSSEYAQKLMDNRTEDELQRDKANGIDISDYIMAIDEAYLEMEEELIGG